MPRCESSPSWKACPWTLGLSAAMVVANLGVLPSAPAIGQGLLGWLQFDRQAALQGQVWRLVTGNLVHWSFEHFLLDAGAFLVVGLMCERSLGRRYPWILAACGLAVGGGILVLSPHVEVYRGLSGVDSGQFVAALWAEAALARREPRRWVWLAPVAAIFTVKIFFECATGGMFFGTEALGDIGLPVPLAHAAGASAALGGLLGCRAIGRRARAGLPRPAWAID